MKSLVKTYLEARFSVNYRILYPGQVFKMKKSHPDPRTDSWRWVILCYEGNKVFYKNIIEDEIFEVSLNNFTKILRGMTLDEIT